MVGLLTAHWSPSAVSPYSSQRLASKDYSRTSRGSSILKNSSAHLPSLEHQSSLVIAPEASGGSNDLGILGDYHREFGGNRSCFLLLNHLLNNELR